MLYLALEIIKPQVNKEFLHLLVFINVELIEHYKKSTALNIRPGILETKIILGVILEGLGFKKV